MFFSNKKEIELNKRTAELDKKELYLSQKEIHLQKQGETLSLQEAALKKAIAKQRSDILSELSRERDRLESEINARNSLFLRQAIEPIINSPRFSTSRTFQDFSNTYNGAFLENPRLISALSESLEVEYPLSVQAKIHSSSGSTYQVSLSACSCPDFKNRKRPCKHMYRLALELGLASAISDSKFSEARTLLRSIRKEQEHLDSAYNNLVSEKNRLSLLRAELQRFEKEEFQDSPYLARLWAEHIELIDLKREQSLLTGSHPAPKAADIVKSIRAEKRVLVEENRLLRHQLDFLVSYLPWLEEYMELTVDEVQAAAAAVEDESNYASEYESLRRWLSQDEYLRLSDSQKYQLALDRYKSRKRSNRDAGIDYERYLGYLFEKDGLSVKYSGALMGKEDMGRDLIVGRGKNIRIVQCKRYAKEKQIHENTVFQLYGSCVQYQLQHPGTRVTGAIYTTTMLSDVARACAQEMGIELYENFPLKDYPMIKCNIGNDGIKRFHLPFSQMYDRLHISPAKGDFYAFTVQEAMDAGFVKAKRWTGNQ